MLDYRLKFSCDLQRRLLNTIHHLCNIRSVWWISWRCALTTIDHQVLHLSCTNNSSIAPFSNLDIDLYIANQIRERGNPPSCRLEKKLFSRWCWSTCLRSTPSSANSSCCCNRWFGFSKESIQSIQFLFSFLRCAR